MTIASRAFHLRRPRHPRGISVIQVVIIVAVVGFVMLAFVAVIGVGILLPALGKARQSARILKDGTQVRGIHQAMVTWAGSNKEFYPLPSQLDRAGATIAPAAPANSSPFAKSDGPGDPQRAKDTTANIYSVMIWNNLMAPEFFVSPAEANPNIVVMNSYARTAPTAAVNPQNAQWDPAFSADFTTGRGNVSYAHMQPSGQYTSLKVKPESDRTGRLTVWRDTYAADTAVVGLRGPQVQSVTANPTTTNAVFANPSSLSLQVFGRGREWRGNVVFNDNHVDTLTIASGTPHNATKRYLTAAGQQLADCIYFDESDDASQSNTYLGIFTKGGEKPSEFKAIWD